MRVKINRNVCPAQLSFCERCLGRFLLFPEGYERRCFEELEDDGKPELTIELRSGEVERVLVLNEDQRKLVAGDGWSSFVDFDVHMYRNGPREITENKPV